MAHTHELPCRAILFDYDGVLVDSRADGERAWRIWAREHCLDEHAVLAGIHGRRSQDTVRAHLPADAQARALNRIEEVEVESAAHTTTIPGADQLLRMVLAHSAIVTSASPRLLDARLAAAGLPCPDVVVTGSDVTHGKPDPEPYLLAAQRLHIPIGQCLVIEDSAAGVAAARAAGAAAVLGIGADAVGSHPDMVVCDLRGSYWTGTALRCPVTPGHPPHHPADEGARTTC